MIKKILRYIKRPFCNHDFYPCGIEIKTGNKKEIFFLCAKCFKEKSEIL
jgi:hypothetical protein